MKSRTSFTILCLLLLVTLCSRPSNAQTCPAFSPVDLFIDMNGEPAGTTVTSANLTAATEGTSIDWASVTSDETFAASQVALPGSLSIIGGTAYGCGYATQSLAVNEAASFPTSIMNFDNGDTQVVASGWIINLPPNQGGAGDLYDYVTLEGEAANAGSVVQVQPGTGESCGAYGMELESYSGGSGGTSHSPCLPITPGSTVFFSVYVNYGSSGNCNGTGSGNVNAPCEGLHVYTTNGTTFTEVGTGVAVALDGTDTLGRMLIGNDENATFSGTSYFQNIMIDYTNHVWPNLPTGGGTSGGTTGSGTSYTLTASTAGTGSGTLGGTNCSSGSYASGTTITCTETPASGSTFAGWSGGTCSGTGSCSFTLSANSTVTATFNTTSSGSTPPSSGSTPLWNGILSPVGSGCNFGTSNVANPCGITWQGTVGLPMGATALSNSATQAGSTIAATGSDQTSAINSALSSCGGTSSQQKYVLLGAGTFIISGTIKPPSYCELRGTLNSSGTASILQSKSGSYDTCEPYTSGDTCIVALGEESGLSYSPVTISGGATAGSTSLTLSSASGMAVGGFLAITETNAAWVSSSGDEGVCSWCDGGFTSNGGRARSQIVEITGISGSVVTIAPSLYTAYTNTPTAVYYTASAEYAGLRDVQIYAGNVGLGADVVIGGCAYCYVKGIEANYADGNWLLTAMAYRPEIRDSYFSNTFDHGPGTFDGDIDISMRTSGALVENNIMERGHNSLMEQWGPSGNVVAYNYAIAGYDNNGYNSTYGGFNMHGAHPQFNLFEGNVVTTYKLDGVWGSQSHNTTFRNWIQQTSKVCAPYTTNGRAAVTSTCFQSPYQTVGQQYDHLSVYGNSVGDVIGSSQLIALGETNVPDVYWISGTANRNMFASTSWGYTYGYGDDSDTGSGNGCDGGTAPCQSTAPWLTSFVYNSYVAGPATTWCQSGGSTGSCPASLPASFYLTSKPSWWTTGIPWPAIGSDITGGTGPGGHTSLISNPAQKCYLSVMGGQDGGVGSPLNFNESTCYGGGSTTVAPAAPINLTNTVVPL